MSPGLECILVNGTQYHMTKETKRYLSHRMWTDPQYNVDNNYFESKGCGMTIRAEIQLRGATHFVHSPTIVLHANNGVGYVPIAISDDVHETIRGRYNSNDVYLTTEGRLVIVAYHSAYQDMMEWEEVHLIDKDEDGAYTAPYGYTDERGLNDVYIREFTDEDAVYYENLECPKYGNDILFVKVLNKEVDHVLEKYYKVNPFA